MKIFEKILESSVKFFRRIYCQCQYLEITRNFTEGKSSSVFAFDCHVLKYCQVKNDRHGQVQTGANWWSNRYRPGIPDDRVLIGRNHLVQLKIKQNDRTKKCQMSSISWVILFGIIVI